MPTGYVRAIIYGRLRKAVAQGSDYLIPGEIITDDFNCKSNDLSVYSFSSVKFSKENLEEQFLICLQTVIDKKIYANCTNVGLYLIPSCLCEKDMNC